MLKRLALMLMMLGGCTPSAVADTADTASLVGTPEVVSTEGIDWSDAHHDPWHQTLADADIIEKQVRVGEATIRYAEGPDNGPPLVLLHAQHMDWYSYSRVLPELSASYHVFAITYHGHGDTQSPTDRLAAAPIGADLAAFLDALVGEPVYLTGNSSGALLSLWLAANAPEQVRAVLLEDPPLFTSELPRSQQTVAYRSFTTCHDFLADGGDDFLLYWLEANKPFVKKHAGALGYAVLRKGITSYRRKHPGERLELNYLPDTVRILVRGLDVYDPHFGDAFYDGRWSEGFDQAEALSRVTAPTMILHARYEIMDDGTLNGALSDEDAQRALSLLRDGSYQKIDADHVVHLDQPSAFVDAVQGFFVDP